MVPKKFTNPILSVAMRTILKYLCSFNTKGKTEHTKEYTCLFFVRFLLFYFVEIEFRSLNVWLRQQGWFAVAQLKDRLIFSSSSSSVQLPAGNKVSGSRLHPSDQRSERGPAELLQMEPQQLRFHTAEVGVAPNQPSGSFRDVSVRP